MLNLDRLKLAALVLIVAGVASVVLFTDNAANPRGHAFSGGPPAGYTRAPGEEREACAECHVADSVGATGQLTLDIPQTYTPGQTYNVTVRHSTADQTRVRWGFQLTALDASEGKAGSLEPLDATTQVLNNQGPFPGRQYVEHTSQGTFPGQKEGASWTFRWTAPSEDVGPVTFYAAGNQANGDGNSSGDHIFFNFAASTFKAPEPDFSVTVTPSSRTFQQSRGSTYDVTVTPLNGFTGQVSLDVSGLPDPAFTSFTPATLDITDASPKSSAFSFGSSPTTPTGTYTLTFTAASGSLAHTAQATAVITKADDADIALAQAISPNPAQLGQDIHFTYTVTNKGPGSAQSTSISVTLPLGAHSFVRGAGPPCTLAPGANDIGYFCIFHNLSPGESASMDFSIRPPREGTFNVSATAGSLVDDPVPADNTISTSILVFAPRLRPVMTVPNLGVRTVFSGLNQPTGMAFIGADDFLALEKATGRVVRIRNGQFAGTALDLAVNSASERGLLGITLHPNFATNGFVYLYWTESSTGADTTAVDDVPLLGNRVDRFVWDGSALAFDRTLLRRRALQQDAGQPSRGNHNGGRLRFGPDGKLYVLVGDVGRRGFLQNLPCGPTTVCPATPLVADDQFGGPEPDDEHATGAVFRLNDDGSIPLDNPFRNLTPVQGGEAVDNIHRLFAYGVRNGFGMDFDPVGGSLWTQENGDDAFDELNRVEPGFNGGWVQLMGPSSRVAEFKAIEVARGNSLQQNRWPPSNLADTPAQALARLYNLPGAKYVEPEFSWKYAVAPSPIGFAGAGLGPQYAGDLFVGASRTTLLGGYLFRLKLSTDRKSISTTDARLADKVADNTDKFDLTESESLLVGRDFGITTDLRAGPNGNLYAVSLSNGAVYEIFSRPESFVATLDGRQETPPNDSPAHGAAILLLNPDGLTASVSLRFKGLTAPQTNAHLHGPARAGQSAAPVFDLPSGNFTDFKITLTPQQASDLRAGLFYVNVHSSAFPGGEIRGQFGPVEATSVAQFDIADEKVSEGAGVKSVRVVRFGDTTLPASIGYATSGGTASERNDYTTARGRLNFAPGETEKTFDVLITDDGYKEGDETVGLVLDTSPDLGAVPDPPKASLTIVDNDASDPTANLIDDSTVFVRQHYHDFLNREADLGGLHFWISAIESCGSDAQCREVARINVSAAFFLSIEFQETGYLVYRLYETSFDRRPRFDEFIADTQEIGRGVIVHAPGWEEKLAANRRAFLDAWVQRPAFRSAFDTLTNAQYVQRLYANAGVTPAAEEAAALVAALDTQARTRARVLLDVADSAALKRAEKSRAFVLMQYFGYLRRNPNDPPDEDFSGYDFWLGNLNKFDGDFVRAELVKAFISSTEYRRRFAP